MFGLNGWPSGECRISSEPLITLPVVTTITLASIVLMLSCASPEFSWDEADYVVTAANHHWGFLWGLSDYDGRHNHGPMALDLAKLGQEVLPAWAGSLEGRSRFFEALVGSFAVGFLYWTLSTLSEHRGLGPLLALVCCYSV